ncbi:MAG TPA: EamA family transporter [Candidatus Eisenbacteria bacterium]
METTSDAPRAETGARDAGAWKPWGAFAGCTLIWSSTFLVIRIGNEALPPAWAASLRLGLAAVILGAIARVRGEGLPHGDRLGPATWYGVLQFGLNFPLLYWGETVLPSGLTAVLFATIPLTVALFAHAFGIEALTPLKIAAAAIGMTGVAVIFGGQIHGAIPPAPFAAVLAAATSASLGTVMLKRGPRQSTFVVNAWGALVGFPICLAVSFALREPHPVPATAAALAPLLYLTVAGSVGAFVLMAWLVQRWPVVRLGIVPVAVPTIAVFLGWLARGETLRPASIAGAILVVSGASLGVIADRAAARPG